MSPVPEETTAASQAGDLAGGHDSGTGPVRAADGALAKVADWLTDSLARRPSGWLARRFYSDPRPHLASFDETLRALALGPDDCLLEIGCGGGKLLERLPFADGEFTAAALANVFFFLYEPERVLRELHRVLGSGGRLAIHTDAPGLPSWLAPITPRMRFYDDAQLVQLLVAAGFSDATVSRTAGGRGQLATARRASRASVPPPGPRR
jgi:SAM-dependent methyltransferase